MAVIEGYDFRIEPKPDHPTNFVHGLLGITPTLSLEGSLPSNYSLPGSIISALRLQSHDHTLFTEENVLLSKPIELIYDAASLETVGEKEIPFRLILDQSELAGFPGTITFDLFNESTRNSSLTLNASKGDKIEAGYQLMAQLETKGSLFTSSKKIISSEDVDLPLYNVPLLAKSERTDTTKFISGVSEGLDYRVTVSRGAFSLGQVVTFTVHHCQTIDPQVVIAKLITRVRQDVVITAKDRSKTVSTFIALGAGKFYPEPVKTAAVGKVSWVGTSTATVEDARKKDKKSVVNAFSSVGAETGGGLFEIQHFAELCVVLRDDRRLCFDVPVEFEAVDAETKEWLIMHTPSIAREV
ncbi:hypothetical protein BDR26DRAFT_853920 [Obelidium mucronatum]|nr:hypothetical protein BDR26DRAFT_853920 [Obelidium mucronatum]